MHPIFFLQKLDNNLNSLDKIVNFLLFMCYKKNVLICVTGQNEDNKNIEL